jgi:hypothetical protein
LTAAIGTDFGAVMYQICLPARFTGLKTSEAFDRSPLCAKASANPVGGLYGAIILGEIN